MTRRMLTAAMVLAVLFAALATISAPRVLAGSKQDAVLLVHGYNANSKIDCNSSTEFGTIRSFLLNNGVSNDNNILCLAFYNGDTDWNSSLQWESSHCTGWYDSGSNDGTVNEDIRHTSCLLAWFIWDQYTYYGLNVEIIAHSMGGIITRQALNDTPYVTAFPNYLYVSDIATAGSPHQGLNPATAFGSYFKGCPPPCTEVSQMEDTNSMMVNMNSKTWRNGFGRNPQAAAGTDWTNLSSQYDEVLQVGNINPETMGCPCNDTGIMEVGWMPGAKHFVGYPGPSPKYNHGGYLTDTSTTWNADEIYSDNNGGTWAKVTNSEHSIYTMYEAILLSTW